MKFCAALEVHGARYDLLPDPAPYFLIVHYKILFEERLDDHQHAIE